MRNTALTPKRRKRRRLIALALTGVALAAAVAFVLLLPTIKKAIPSAKYNIQAAENRARVLATTDPARLQSIAVSTLNGDNYTLRWHEGALKLERDGRLLDIAEAYNEEFISLATSIRVQDTVSADLSEVLEHLADMGLEPPQATAVVRFADGGEQVLQLGLPVPETGYYYYRWSGDEGVYMCDAGVADALSLMPGRLLPVEQPAMESSLIGSLTVKNRGNDEIALVFSPQQGGGARLTAPFAYPAETEAAQALLTTLANFRLGATQAVITPENEAQYGFDDPLCVFTARRREGVRTVVDANGQMTGEQTDARVFRFAIGREEGDYYYTCAYEGVCYLVSRFLTEQLIDARVEGLLSLHPASLEGASIASVTVRADGGTLDLRVTRTERVLPNNALEVDENGDIVYDTAAYLNGVSIPAEQANAFIERLANMKAAGEVAQGWSRGDASPRWQITLSAADGATRSLAAYAMDPFSYAVSVDGVIRHYVYVEALSMALSDIELQ